MIRTMSPLEGRSVVPAHFRPGAHVDVPASRAMFGGPDVAMMWVSYAVTGYTMGGVEVREFGGIARFGADARILFHQAGTCARCDADRGTLLSDVDVSETVRVLLTRQVIDGAHVLVHAGLYTGEAGA